MIVGNVGKVFEVIELFLFIWKGIKMMIKRQNGRQREKDQGQFLIFLASFENFTNDEN